MDMDVSAAAGIDVFLDLSNDQLFSSSSTSSSSSSSTSAAAFNLNLTTTTASPNYSNNHLQHFSYPADHYNNINHHPSNFTDHIHIPKEEIDELEWLSKFVDDSSTDIPKYSVTGTMNVPAATTSLIKSSRSNIVKRSKTVSDVRGHPDDVSKRRTVLCHRERSPSSSTDTMMMPPRRCTHCSSEKTPQWRTGPLGPKTLCNACGVRYKSGRLVPEYRPAASPTFVLAQHSNSHRKVMELRRQKELFLQQQQQQLQKPKQELYC